MKADKHEKEQSNEFALEKISKDFESVDQKKRVTVIIYETHLTELHNLMQQIKEQA